MHVDTAHDLNFHLNKQNKSCIHADNSEYLGLDNVDISSSDNDVRNVVFNNLQPVIAAKSNVVYPCTDTSFPVEFDTHFY